MKMLEKHDIFGPCDRGVYVHQWISSNTHYDYLQLSLLWIIDRPLYLPVAASAVDCVGLSLSAGLARSAIPANTRPLI